MYNVDSQKLPDGRTHPITCVHRLVSLSCLFSRFPHNHNSLVFLKTTSLSFSSKRQVQRSFKTCFQINNCLHIMLTRFSHIISSYFHHPFLAQYSFRTTSPSSQPNSLPFPCSCSFFLMSCIIVIILPFPWLRSCICSNSYFLSFPSRQTPDFFPNDIGALVAIGAFTLHVLLLHSYFAL